MTTAQGAHQLAHELLTPLSGITMMLSTLQRAPELQAHSREQISRCLRTSARMRQLIRDAVDFADAGCRDRALTDVDCNEALSAALAELKEAEAESGASIDACHLPTVRGDGPDLQRLFRHVIDNGIRYRGAAPPHITISCERDRDAWKLSVADRGIGIEASEQETVFEPFRRLHSYDEVPGSGLGLALCRRIVERHGGQIGLASEPGKGTTVWFTLPDAGSRVT